MKVLNQVKVTVKDGKEEKREALREGVKVVDSVADNLIVDGEQSLKRQINITGIKQLTPNGDKVVKSKVIEIWEEQPKKKELAKKETKK